MSERRPGARTVGISVLLHVVVLAPLLVFTHLPEPIEFETVKIHLVSRPTAAVEAPAPQPVVETAPQPEPEEPPPEVKPEPEAKPVEKPVEKPPEPKRKEPPKPETEKRPEAPKPKPEAEPKEEAEAGGDALDVATEGKDFPYPDYLENVINQIYRYLRWNDSSQPQMLVYFEITSDGQVRNVRPLRGSGNPVFDFRVMGAIEAAAKRKAFGPLPEGYAADVLPIKLTVEPAR